MEWICTDLPCVQQEIAGLRNTSDGYCEITLLAVLPLNVFNEIYFLNSYSQIGILISLSRIGSRASNVAVGLMRQPSENFEQKQRCFLQMSSDDVQYLLPLSLRVLQSNYIQHCLQLCPIDLFGECWSHLNLWVQTASRDGLLGFCFILFCFSLT